MKTFRDFINSTRTDVTMSERTKYLAEMPQRIPSISRDKVVTDVQSFWDIAKDENPRKVGKIGSEEVYMVGTSALRYYFILKNDTPTFFVGLDKRVDLSGWQITYTAKINTAVKYVDFLKFLSNKQSLPVISGGEQSPAAEKLWKRLLKDPKVKWTAHDDFSGKKVDVDDVDKAWPSDIVFKILKIK